MNVQELIRTEGFRRGLRPQTIKTYQYIVNKFLRIYRLDPFNVKKKNIEQHLNRLLESNKSGSTLNVHLQALKFFYEKVLHRKLTMYIPLTKVGRRLPEFLTQDEIKILFNSITNVRHKLMITFLYASGFRVSELVRLKVKDLDLDSNYGWIRDSKGGKDRMFIIAEQLNYMLRNWIECNQLTGDDYLFEGNSSHHYSTQSIRAIIKKAVKITRLTKKIHPHSLRHSFATHILENGYSIMEVQPLLGHARLETTMIYTHLASPQLTRVKSPYDSI